LDRNHISKIAIFYTLVLLILSIIPVPEIGFPRFHLFEFDKLMHFFVYFSLTILWYFAFEIFYNSYLKLLLSAIFFGFVLEIFQYLFSFGRYFDLADLLANTLGVIFGIIILYYLKKKLL
tara:strand:+ start:76 stop:435 length:360 start_codon:yes stop_codon:yes gene_type:complete